MTARTIAKVILVTAATVAFLYFLYLIREILGLLAISAFLAIALGPAVDWLQRRRIPRGLAILVSYLAMIGAIFLVGLVVVPPIAAEVQNFVERTPQYITELRESETIREYDDRYQITGKLREQADRLPERLGGAVEALRSVTVGVFSAIFAVVTVLVMTFFLLLDGKRLVRFAERELGPVRGPRMRAIADNVYRAVGGYVVGMFSIASLAGFLTWIVLTILGVEFAVPLAVLMVFLDLIPQVGSAIGGILIAIVAAISDFPTALIVWTVFFVIYQQVENNVLQPLVFRHTIAVPPLLVIVSVLIGLSLLGVLGALVAVPVAAAVQIIVKDYWKHAREAATPLDPITGEASRLLTPDNSGDVAAAAAGSGIDPEGTAPPPPERPPAIVPADGGG